MGQEWKRGTWCFGPGVYALLWRGEVVYVGKARDVMSRVCQHKNNWRRGRVGKAGWGKAKSVLFDGFAWVECCVSDLDRVEREMIRRWNPPGNYQHARGYEVDIGARNPALWRRIVGLPDGEERRRA